MKAMLSAELIGENRREIERVRRMAAARGVFCGWPRRPFGAPLPTSWVARLVRRGRGFDREFLRGRRDYSGANSTGSRGIRMWWVIESGEYYEAQLQTGWHVSDRFFCAVADDGSVARVMRVEVETWASAG